MMFSYVIVQYTSPLHAACFYHASVDFLGFNTYLLNQPLKAELTRFFFRVFKVIEEVFPD